MQEKSVIPGLAQIVAALIEAGTAIPIISTFVQMVIGAYKLATGDKKPMKAYIDELEAEVAKNKVNIGGKVIRLSGELGV